MCERWPAKRQVGIEVVSFVTARSVLRIAGLLLHDLTGYRVYLLRSGDDIVLAICSPQLLQPFRILADAELELQILALTASIPSHCQVLLRNALRKACYLRPLHKSHAELSFPWDVVALEEKAFVTYAERAEVPICFQTSLGSFAHLPAQQGAATCRVSGPMRLLLRQRLQPRALSERCSFWHQGFKVGNALANTDNRPSGSLRKVELDELLVASPEVLQSGARLPPSAALCCSRREPLRPGEAHTHGVQLRGSKG
mmetsp:Transcript_10024/g.25023  ORF Transcript_10024/g.25023 Transcript_10024/m.25023 type:complete len:256 (+) Transcript_10024:796-1563(+)